ncbi:centrosomal protein of 120 kDa isoform X2 [Lingula anatina]|uniref:Centrosomal protein of 120 kDa isoform X1 n=1 Tax=Lingula anatina TaxID=7574 RepID=A0A1S3HGB8_LINAN|nr:centrosomal protein of 120 kDa isoform X1 [Lingula anatina]XP_013385111.1 centrosomal protein of 120 kDa isoform X2 [Lingula anatina]|eukprot:XP_013385110.1 centrosomal protein of 120 kDa isoform X1 [Lingula anatina]
MVTNGKYLVVVAVLEGRNFPRRPKHKIIVDAKFDGELLSTDPVDHVENPDFTQELAWELDKKGLYQHRLQRSSIRVQCYAYDPLSTMRENLGYIVLDLRSAQNKQTSKWYQLLLPKYSKSKPEMRLGIYVEDDKKMSQTGFKAKDAPARAGQIPLKELSLNDLKPVLNEAEGYYQLGPEDRCNEHFMLSITISFATNLPQLIPTNMPLPASANGYFFYYALFGNDVTNATFYDLLNPSFPIERDSVRLRSSPEALQLFLERQPGIQIHLCCGDQSLGSAEVPLNSMLKKDSNEIYMRPVIMEGVFHLSPPNRTKQQLPPVPEDMRPAVGVSVTMRKEEQIQVTPSKQHTDSTDTPPVLEDHIKETKKQKGKSADKKKHRPQDEQYKDSFAEATGDSVSSLEEEKKEQRDKDKKEIASQREDERSKSLPVTPEKQSESSPPSQQPARVAPAQPTVSSSTSTTTQGYVAIPPQSRHFSVTVDLRSLRDLATDSYINAYVRYTYAFFGSAAPKVSHPAVEVQRGREVLLPQGVCTFDFAATLHQLQETFMTVPLVVEVWDRDKNKAQDTLFGVTRISMAHLLAAEQSRVVKSDNSVGWRQVYDTYCSLMSVDGAGKRVGELHAVLSLEDLGLISTQHVYVNNEQHKPQVYATDESSTTLAPPPAPPAVPPQPEPRETIEYKAALELEMWKDTQEQVFETQLKEKELHHLRALAEEWKRRDKERELLVQKKISEYSQLEEQLRKTLADLDRRERQLESSENEITRIKADLQREHEYKLHEMREASRRMQEDCEHKIQLERTKTQTLEEQIGRLKQELINSENKVQSLERDFSVYKEQQSSKPEVRLQSEINLLTLEKAELERKLDSVSKSKVHYKQQWGRALKELARMKEKEQAVAKRQLRKQQQELEHMRLRYLAAEEKEVVKAEKLELEEIKQEVNRLKEQENQKQQQQQQPLHKADISSTSPGGSVQYTPLQPDPDTTIDERIARLIEERDALLRTGVYTHEDRIIAELDRQIREAIARKSS